MLQLKIMDKWAVLPDDFTLDMVTTNPLFADDGEFSYPFQIPYTPNRHIFGVLSDPYGNVRLNKFHGQPAEIWFDGNQIFTGQMEMSDSVEFSEDKVSFNVVANNGSLKDKIDELSCRNVPLKDEITIGWRPKAVNLGGQTEFVDDGKTYKIDRLKKLDVLDTHVMFPIENNAMAYPDYPYCNIDVCAPNAEDNNTNQAEDSTGSGYAILPYNRLDSAPCFFVLYFLDCLFAHFDMAFDNSVLVRPVEEGGFEDLKRLAFVNFKAQYEMGEDVEVWPARQLRRMTKAGNYYFPFNYAGYETLKYVGMYYPGNETDTPYETTYIKKVQRTTESFDVVDCYATSDNFPDTDVSSVMDDLKNAFGIRFVYDQNRNTVTAVFVKDVMVDGEVLELDCNVMETPYVTRELNYGTKMSYGEDSDTAYDYTMPDGSIMAHYGSDEVKGMKGGVVLHDNYSTILSMTRSSTDTNTHYDLSTGNAYRIKVNEDTGGDPQIFEVGQFRPFRQNVSDEKKAQEISINFSPVATNDVYEFTHDTKPSNRQQQLLVYSDAEIYNSCGKVPVFNKEGYEVGSEVMPTSRGNIATLDDGDHGGRIDLTLNGDDIIDISNGVDYNNATSALESSDAGYQLGFMRGMNVKDGISFSYNYDTEGNDSWVEVVDSYAFTADCIDAFGRSFDYNGNDDGGVGLAGRLSLCLETRKVKKYSEDGIPEYYDVAGADAYDISHRGLVPKLLSEFMFFQEHKVTVTVPVYISLTTLRNINLLKRYRIGEHVGFINKISYKLSSSGVSDCIVEMFSMTV